MNKYTSDPRNPWAHVTGDRDYLTPEDIQAAINAGGSRLHIWGVVLEAMSKRYCEDWSLCAFVAYRFEIDHVEP